MAIEIRLHGRGGQGGVTCAKILAALYARIGRSVQTFGDYAGERSGAPVRAYTRVSDQPITNRNKVYTPDHLLVLDPTLLGQEALSGLGAGGTLLVNSPEPEERFGEPYAPYRLAVVDATAIARKHGIGTRSVIIVNTTIAGAFVRAMDLSLEVLEDTYRHLGLLSNLPAALEAWEAVKIREKGLARASEVKPVAAPASARVTPLTEHLVSPAPALKTGSWRTQRPRYRNGLPPCNAWCPAGNDVLGFIQALAREGEATARVVLGRSQPLASVCGRVCPAPCMEGCNRREYDGAVNIRALERWIGDSPRGAVTPVPRAEPCRSVAIVGSGPAGLAAAFTVARAGHRTILFEREQSLGGVLRTGIPAYRLPREVVDREVGAILALGVEARTGEAVDAARLETLAREHDALILATGLQRLRDLDAPGSTLSGIEQGIRFLHRVNLGGGAQLSGHVVVLGGGNTAMDCARSALRSGAARVTVAYRRTREEMPAIREEVEEAIQEGVELLLKLAPVGFAGSGRVRGVELAEVEMGEPDETGRRRPVVTARTRRLECDHVLLALGQSADLSLLPEGWKIQDGRVSVNGRSLNVFAAGDVSTGDGTVTHAIGDGRRAAGRALLAIDVDTVVFERPDRTRAVPLIDIRLDHFERRLPARDRHVDVVERLRGFGEVNRGLLDVRETERCFSCGNCTRCDTCLVYCPEGIIRRKELGYEVDYSYCKGCGICVTECPREAMEMVPECRAS